jgi:hypothetical protein
MGEKLMPIEPTEEMMRAGLKAFALVESSDWTRQQVLQAIWQAMRDAAPARH